MRKGNRTARRYLREAKSWLPCSGKQKRDILARIENVVNDYVDQNPDADYSEIMNRFGTPRQIAAAYVDDMDTEELLGQHRTMGIAGYGGSFAPLCGVVLNALYFFKKVLDK